MGGAGTTTESPGLFKRVLASDLFATKNLETILAEGKTDKLKRTLNVWDLTSVGIGGIIGAGIFVLTGTVAAKHAGPAVVLSFIVAGFAALFAALCYAELASMIPISGSAYTYTAASMGAFPAWIIGWDLLLEYLMGAATVAVSWSGYLVTFLKQLGLHLNPKWCGSAVTFVEKTHSFVHTGRYCNIPAIVIVLAITALLVVGIKESAHFNTTVVSIKIVVILLFIFGTASHVNPDLWEPFIPEATGTYGHFGAGGVFQGATIIFFAYIGFDAVSTTAQECHNPQRDLPIGTLLSLGICTSLYIVVSLMVTALLPYKELDVPDPISHAVASIPGMKWLTIIISIGALAGLTSVMLVNLLAQPRIIYSMSADGLFPSCGTSIHPRFKTPWLTTITTGVICAAFAGFFPIGVLSELTSVGTLFAFFMVSVGVIILRHTQPDAPRKFKVPGGTWFIPVLGALSNLALVCTAAPATILRLFIWMAVGVIIFFAYGRQRVKELGTFGGQTHVPADKAENGEMKKGEVELNRR